MNIAETIKYFEFYHCVNHTLTLQANHGVGKSELVRIEFKASLARKYNCSLDEILVIDKRASQLEPSDLTGGLFEVGGRTYNAPPYWLPVHEDSIKALEGPLKEAGRQWVNFVSTKYKAIILFLDELNRAQSYTKQALFELKLDRSLHGIKIPDNCYIITAENSNAELYDVSEAEPADKDREVVIQFMPSVEEWLTWANRKVAEQRIHEAVTMYISQNEDHLDPSEDEIRVAAADGGSTYSRRSWTRLGESLMHAEGMYGKSIQEIIKDPSERVLFQAAAEGHVGMAESIAFSTFVIEDYDTLNPKDILDHWDKKMAKRIEALADLDNEKGEGKANLVKVSGLTTSIVEELKTRGKLTKQQEKNILAYLELVGRENVSSFWEEWCSAPETKEQAVAWYCTPKREHIITKSICNSVAYDEEVARKIAAGEDIESDERTVKK